MKPNSGLHSKTSGIKKLVSNNKKLIINNINKNKINKIPEKNSQIDHIFRKGDGHITFSEKNAQKLSNLINNEKNIILEKDKYGKTWYAKINKDGTQTWGSVYNNTLSDGGINSTPRKMNKETGLNKFK
ncbi:MAG: hypothetical protein IKZ96_01185 [Bacilli bacterium]|nr:hypothetical protein [Bacilli bacterium]